MSATRLAALASLFICSFSVTSACQTAHPFGLLSVTHQFWFYSAQIKAGVLTRGGGKSSCQSAEGERERQRSKRRGGNGVFITHESDAVSWGRCKEQSAVGAAPRVLGWHALPRRCRRGGGLGFRLQQSGGLRMRKIPNRIPLGKPLLCRWRSEAQVWLCPVARAAGALCLGPRDPTNTAWFGGTCWNGSCLGAEVWTDDLMCHGMVIPSWQGESQEESHFTWVTPEHQLPAGAEQLPQEFLWAEQAPHRSWWSHPEMLALDSGDFSPNWDF